MIATSQAQSHQARCLPHLLTLRMLARDDAEPPSPGLARAEVARAVSAILGEAEAAARDAQAAAVGTPDPDVFLSVRLTRLAAAASDALTAAGAGDFPQLRRHLCRFEVLTSAIWAVQDASR